jgi:hypothetical protein
MAEESKGLTVAYVPFRTFIGALDSLAQGVPHVIDRSIFPQMSGVTQGQVMGALRFLGLINAQGKPSAELHALATQKDKRKENLRRVIEHAYPELIQSDLSKATPSSLNQAFEKFAVTGETNQKAKSFFLQAAKECGIALSPYLLKVTRTVSKRKKSAPQAAKDQTPGLPDNDDALDQSLNMTAPGVKKVIYLDNSAVLTLTVDRNFGELPSKQRRFVNELIDKMEDFVEEMMAEEEEALRQREARPKDETPAA